MGAELDLISHRCFSGIQLAFVWHEERKLVEAIICVKILKMPILNFSVKEDDFGCE